MAFVIRGPRSWRASRDAEGHREYRLRTLVKTADKNDGPALALLTPGLPTIGSVWALGNDYDPWAWCRPDATVDPQADDGDPNKGFFVEQVFSTKPLSRCQDAKVEDPLLEPQKVSGGWVKKTREATDDRFGAKILSTSHEQFRGEQVTFDESDDTVVIEQNVAVLNYAAVNAMKDTLNDRELWGMPPRTIKLSGFTWEKKYYGFCFAYYTRKFTFEVSSRGFDRDILDEGTKALKGHWEDGTWVLEDIQGGAPDPANPAHFIRMKDANGENMRVILNHGLPATVAVQGTPVTIVASVAWADDFNPVIANQPTNPSKLLVSSTDADASLDLAQVTITGTDDHDQVIEEVVYFGYQGTVALTTTRLFKTVTQVLLNTAGTPGGSDTVAITTDASELQAGTIHVEKYGEANFLELSIPIVF